MTQQLYVIDSFADRPFAGNPAAVCLLPASRPDAWLQAVAREMSLSETAFLLSRPDGDFSLRWFTPSVEVRLCGHATLASAHMLWETGALPQGRPAIFTTLSGELIGRRAGDWIEMDFPRLDFRAAPPPPALVEAVDSPFVASGMGGDLNWLVELINEDAVRAARPNFALLSTIPVQGVIVTARSDDSRYDFVSRYFAPACGVDEDPVTGSAHCALGPYWASKLGRGELTGYQASERGGVVGVVVRNGRVLLRGQARTISRVELLAEPGEPK